MMNNNCKHCKEPLPVRALHFSNETAIAKGYCCYFCMVSVMGETKALRALQRYLKKRVDKPQEARSQGGEYVGMDKNQHNRGNSGNSGKGDVLRLILEDDREEVRDKA